MGSDFIQVNRSILDFSEYSKNVLLLKNYLKHRFIELLLEEGFQLESEKSKAYCELDAIFYNEARDLELKICICKRELEKFV